MLLFLLLVTLCCVAYGAPSSPPTQHKLLSNNSADTMKNRQFVKDLLMKRRQKVATAYKKKQGEHQQTKRDVEESAPQPPPIPVLNTTAPGNATVPKSIWQINKNITDWMFETDIILTPDQALQLIQDDDDDSDNEGKKRKKRAMQTDPNYYWNPAVPINYTFDSSLTASTIASIRLGIAYWNQYSCLSFTENANGNNRLQFFNGGGCWSYIGRQANWTSQEVSIGNGCQGLGIVTHEIGHALGFYHTQSRYDRDSFIYVNFGNIPASLQYNFVKQTPATDNNFNYTYDFGSVMHYDTFAFANNNSVPTIVTLNPLYQNTIGQRVAPAFSDVREVNLLYNCSSRCSRKPNCQNGGIPDSRNCNQCICPRMFAGPLCDQIPKGSAPNCQGGILKATNNWQFLNGSAGWAMDYFVYNTTADCYWQIAAPVGQKVQIILTPPAYCQANCPWQAMELNLGQYDMYGMIICCPLSNSQLTSVNNSVSMRAFAKYNYANFTVQYRIAGGNGAASTVVTTTQTTRKPSCAS